MKGQRLQVVNKFTYLGSALSRVVHIDDEVNARIAKASAAFGRLRGSIWDRSGIRLDTKLKVYRSVVLPTLLYACLDSLPTACQKTGQLPYKLSLKTYKDQMARQESRHRSPENGRDAECTYSSEICTIKMDRSCYQNTW